MKSDNAKLDSSTIGSLAEVLSKQIDKDLFEKKYAPVKEVLKLIGVGFFVVGALAVPNLPLVLKPFLDKERKEEYEVWKRFNIPYLKRAIQRLEKQKLVEIDEEKGKQVVRITHRGQEKVIRMALDELVLTKPKFWDKKWRLVSFDLPEDLSGKRKILVEYLKVWGFYPLHKSVYLHAYPCFQQLEFLRDYLGIGEYVRLFKVERIENDQLFRDFFGV